MGAALVLLMLVGGCGQNAADEGSIPITTESDEAHAYFIQGRTALDVGRTEDARELLDKAIEADPTLAIAYFYRARVARTPAEWKKFTDLAKEHSTNASNGEKLMIGMIPYFVSDDREAVLEQAKELEKAYPESPRAAMEVAYALGGMKQTEARREKLQSITEKFPEFASAYRQLANSYTFDDPTDYSAAEKAAKKYVQLVPNEADSHILLGDVYRAQVELTKARDAYQKAVEVDPDQPVAYAKLGHANTFLGDFDQARADFQAAMKHAEGGMKASGANFGVYTYVYAGDLPSALNANAAVMQNLQTMIPDEDQQKQAMARCLEDRVKLACEAGAFDIAHDAFAEHARLEREITSSVDIEDFSSSVESSLSILQGWIAAKEGKYDEAMAHADAAAEHLASSKNPNKLDATYLLKGYIALQKGDTQEALDYLGKSDQDWFEVKFFTARAEEALGNTDRAMELYKEVADWNFNSLDYAVIRNEARAKLG